MFIDKAELERMYDDAFVGSDAPDLVIIHCPECNQDFVLTAKRAEICEHLRARFDEDHRA